MQDCAASILNAGPRQLAYLLGLDTAEPGEWGPDELGAILRHQLDAPLSVDLPLSPTAPWAGPGIEPSATGASSEVPGTFADLFHRPDPPTQLLRVVKDFAKANCCHPASALPNDIATLLYYETIVAARLHARQRISQLTEEELRAGVTWVLEQTWVDERTRGLFTEALLTLPARPEPGAAARVT
jgi:hypothetical protein